MKVIVEQKVLAKVLSAAGKFIPPRPAHPVLANVKLVAFEGRLSIIAYDLSIGVELDCLSDVLEDGVVTVPSKLLSEIVTKADGDLTLEVQNNTLKITTAKGDYTLATGDFNEYPDLPQVSQKAFQMDAKTLQESIKSVLFASSEDITKQILTGVNFTGTDDWWKLAATDGHRLAVIEIGTKPEDISDEVNVTIPAQALKELSKLLSDDAVEVFYEPGQGVIKLPGVYMTFRSLEGVYPAYSQLIPRSFERTATLNRKDFLSALERITVLADRKNNIIQARFSAIEQQVILSVEAADVGSGRELVSIQLEGTTFDIGFNAKYLKESLTALMADVVQLRMNSTTSPVVIEPLKQAVTHLVMPVQMRS